MTVEDPDGQNIWIWKDGATRRSAAFAIGTIERSNEHDEDFDLVDLDEEQPLMAHIGQLDGLAPSEPEEQVAGVSNQQE
eukprot:10115387-Prorocentrum_lima.AAC.1